MGPSRKLFYSVSSLLPARMLKGMTPGLLLPYHHLVSDEDVLHVKHLYSYKNIAQFTADLDVLLKHLRPVQVEEVAAAVTGGKPLPKNAFLLTFDDGFREVYDVIAPILAAKGVPAVFFVNPAFLDNRLLFYRCKISLVIEALLQKRDQPTLWRECGEIMGQTASGDLPNPPTGVPNPLTGLSNPPTDLPNRTGDHPARLADLPAQIKKITNLNQELLDKMAALLGFSFDEYLAGRRPFMTTAQAWELHQRGFTIGAHSLDHPYYDLIPEEEQRRQTFQSMEFVKQKFAPACNLFSFPHSDAGLSQGFFDRLFAVEVPVDVFFGIQNQKDEPGNRMLHRFNAERPDLPMSRQLNGVLLYMLIQKISGRRTVRRH